MAPLYIFRGRKVRSLSYDDANGLTAVDNDSLGWWFRATESEGDSLWDAPGAPQSVRRWRAYEKSIGGSIYEIGLCCFCGSDVSSYWLRDVVYDNPATRDQVFDVAEIVVCYQCGWYRTERRHALTYWALPAIASEVARLERGNIGDDRVPLEELRAHLARHWGDRKHISPSQAEALVADVFREHLDGEILYTTNGVYSQDGGVDFVIVQSAHGVASAFQVKRRLTDSAESITEVRSFLGALAGSPFSHGYFVTTAPRFTRATIEEGRRTKANLKKRAINLEIVDGDALHRILCSKKERPSFSALSEWARDYERAGKWTITRGEEAGQEVSFGEIIAK